jgi:hypothetical protein
MFCTCMYPWQCLTTTTGTFEFEPVLSYSDDELYPESPHTPVSWEAMSVESSSQVSASSQSDSALSEYIKYVKTILSQLVRVTIAIRKSGNKYRFEEVDAQCHDGRFESFRHHLATIILKSSEDDAARNKAQQLSAAEKSKQASDPSRLTVVQERLIRANVLRRNRIEYMTKSSGRTPKPSLTPEPTLIKDVPVATPPVVMFDTESRGPRGFHDVRSGDSTAAALIAPSDTSTVAITATEPGSELEITPIIQKRTFSTVTKLTRIGASQTYPRCPNRTPGEPLICPYCNEQLPPDISGSREESSWR